MACTGVNGLKLEKNSGLNRISIYDLCNIGAVLYQLSYLANWAWGPFLERPGNLTGPKSYFEIKFSRKVGCVLTSNEVHFVSLAENFTVQFSNLLKLLSRMKNKTA